MTGYIIVFLIGFFLGAFTASKTFRTKIINWWKRYAEGEKSKKKGAK